MTPPLKHRVLTALLLLGPLFCGSAAGRRFYDDDPLHATPRPRDVSKVLPRKFSDYFDFLISTFGSPAGVKKATPIPRARAMNTLGEPMDSAWWQRRHYYKPMSIEELVRGAGNTNAPSTTGRWLVTRAKSEGITPGFTIEDAKGETYYLKFDPLDHPEIATAPDVLVSKIFYALGYHVPENYIVEFDLRDLIIRKGTQISDRLGRVKPMTSRDVTEIMLSVPKLPNGKYRAVASRALKGEWVGPFRYWGTRKDDPNDIVDHEHRRDLRGLAVAAAWVGHDDSRAINTVDFRVTEDGVSFVKHYLIDFGSTLGSATTKPNSPRSGFEYVWEFKPALVQFLSLGLVVPDWAKARYPDLPSAGRLEYEKFDALNWKPEYPNLSFSNALPDDRFWMAKQVMSLSDEAIRAIVSTGQYSNDAAEDWVAECLIRRRDKIGRAHFTLVLPIDRFEVRDGKLVFENLAVKYGFETEPAYQVHWTVFDNDRETHAPLASKGSFEIPPTDEPYVAAHIQGRDSRKTVVVYLRGSRSERRVVGVERSW